jgi:hypothetical protein
MASEPPKPNIDLGRVIGRGFNVLKANFLPFFGFALLLAGLPGFFQVYLAGGFGREDLLTGAISLPFYLGALLLGTAVSFLSLALLQGVLTRSTILALGGRESDPGGSAVHALRLVLPIIGISICVGLLIVCGFILLVVPGIMVWCALSVAIPVLVEERKDVFDSISRSRDLTRGSRLSIFLLGVLVWIISVVIGGVVSVLTGATMFPTAGAMPNILILALGQGLAASLTNVINTVFIAALYVELREVKEGVATDLLADVFG